MALPPLELFSLEEEAALLPGGLFVLMGEFVLLFRRPCGAAKLAALTVAQLLSVRPEYPTHDDPPS